MTNFTGLPEGQIRCLHAIVRHIEDTGMSPTYDEIATAIGGTKQNAKGLVDELVAKGRLARDDKKHRSITVIEEKKGLKNAR